MEEISEADRVRNALHDDPTVSNADYGRLVEEATDADDARALNAEQRELEREWHVGLEQIAHHGDARVTRLAYEANNVISGQSAEIKRLRHALETLAQPNRGARPTGEDAREMAAFARRALGLDG